MKNERAIWWNKYENQAKYILPCQISRSFIFKYSEKLGRFKDLNKQVRKAVI